MHDYFTVRGLKIPKKRVGKDLISLEKSEAEVRDFLGKYADLPGVMPDFLNSLIVNITWAEECRSRGYTS